KVCTDTSPTSVLALVDVSLGLPGKDAENPPSCEVNFCWVLDSPAGVSVGADEAETIGVGRGGCDDPPQPAKPANIRTMRTRTELTTTPGLCTGALLKNSLTVTDLVT